MKKEIEESILRSSSIIKGSISLSSDIEKAVTVIVNCLKKGNKVILFGNGGSASDSQHLATELVVRYKKNRKAIASVALSADNSAYFKSLFAR